MPCSQPKGDDKKFSRRDKVCHNPDIWYLRDSETIRSQYSKQLDELLEQTPSPEQVDDIEEHVVNAITTVSAKTIPPRQEEYGWM